MKPLMYPYHVPGTRYQVPGNRVIVNAESSSTNSNTMWYELELELNPGTSCMTLQRFTAVLANVDNLGSNITTPASSIQHPAFQFRVAPNVPTLHPHPIYILRTPKKCRRIHILYQVGSLDHRMSHRPLRHVSLLLLDMILTNQLEFGCRT